MSLLTPTVPIVPGSDYFEEARERFEERIRNPGGVFGENLQQGTTGPAPALTVNEEGHAQIEHPEGFGDLNRSIIRVAGGDPLMYERFNEESEEQGRPISEQIRDLAIIGGVFAVFLVLLNAVAQGIGEGLVS